MHRIEEARLAMQHDMALIVAGVEEKRERERKRKSLRVRVATEMERDSQAFTYRKKLHVYLGLLYI